MSASAIPLVTGLAGVLTQADQNHGLQAQQQHAQNSQADLIARQTQMYDMLRGIAQSYDKQGAFDPDVQLAQLDKDIARNSATEMGNSAGALRTAGYRPGDSVYQDTTSEIGARARTGREQLATQIRQNSIGQKLAAYGAANPAMLNTGIAAYGQNAMNAQNQQQGYGGLLSSLSPFMGSNQTRTAGMNTGTPSVWGQPGHEPWDTGGITYGPNGRPVQRQGGGFNLPKL